MTILAAVTGCETTASIRSPAIDPPAVDLPAPYSDHGVLITVDGLWRNGDGQVLGVSGTAKNVGNVDLITCMINLAIVDASGIKVTDAVASTQGLDRGQTWRFQAAILAPFSVSFKAVRPGKVLVFAQRR